VVAHGPLNHFSRSKSFQPTSVSPNHDAISKSLYYLRSEAELPLKHVTANDLADGNMGTCVKLAWSLFSQFALTGICDAEGRPSLFPVSQWLRTQKGGEESLRRSSFWGI
jgi:hypothetical protein